MVNTEEEELDQDTSLSSEEEELEENEDESEEGEDTYVSSEADDDDEESDGDDEDDEEDKQGEDDDDEIDDGEVVFDDETHTLSFEDDIDDKKVIVSLRTSEIPDLLKKARQGEKIVKYASEAEAYMEHTKSAVTIGNLVQKDNFLTTITLWRYEGYTEQQIAEALGNHYKTNMNNDNDSDEFTTEDLDPAMLKEVEKRIAPLQQRLDDTQTQWRESQIEEQNDSILRETFSDAGIQGGLSEDEQTKFIATFQDLYPGFNNKRNSLTAAQIRAAINESGVKSGRNTQQSTTKNKKVTSVTPPRKTTAAKKSPPRIASGSQGKRSIAPTTDNSTSREARISRAASIFFK